jgi:porin
MVAICSPESEPYGLAVSIKPPGGSNCKIVNLYRREAGMRARLFAILLVMASSQVAIAQEDKKTDDDKPADPDTGESTIEEKTLGLLPNPLQKYGVKFAATYIGETLGNFSGGLKRGAVYEGRLNLAMDADLQKLIGVDQLTFHANVFQIHGGGLSRGSLQNLFVVSGIEALPSTRLYEAYFEKQWGNKWVSLKIGQLAADSEFFNTKYTDVLTNASMGWPAITSTNLPSGGPSPPLAAMGARVLVKGRRQRAAHGQAWRPRSRLDRLRHDQRACRQGRSGRREQARCQAPRAWH